MKHIWQEVESEELPNKVANVGGSRHYSSFGFYSVEFLCRNPFHPAGISSIRAGVWLLSHLQRHNLLSWLVD